MRNILFLCGVVLTVLATAIPTRAGGGLYGDDAGKITSGDLKDRDYWRAKWASLQIDQALKERQPEGAVLMQIISEVSLLDDLVKKYPNHEEIKKWREHAVQIRKACDPDADRHALFKPGCLWNEPTYREAYVGYNCGKSAIADKDWPMAHDCLSDADKQLGFLKTRLERGEGTANWPEDFVKWIKDTKREVADLNEMVDVKRK